MSAFESVSRYIVALAETEGQPLSWWTGDLELDGSPTGTASYTMAMDFETAERAERAAAQCRLPGAWRVQPMVLTRRLASARG